MSIKKIIVILFIILLGLYILSVYIPLLSPTIAVPLFYIENEDGVSHDVRVEIFDENNVSVFNNTYLLGANNSTRFEKEVSWNFPFPSKIVTWYDGKYTFNFTVDNNSSNEITRDINQYMSVTAIIKPSSNEDDEIVIDIKIMSV
jgi:ABC-type dipeptide/oligopeptide/nickel transport system permease component